MKCLPNSSVDEVYGYKINTLIAIVADETQVAAVKGQAIHKAFDDAGLLKESKLRENDIETT